MSLKQRGQKILNEHHFSYRQTGAKQYMPLFFKRGHNECCIKIRKLRKGCSFFKRERAVQYFQMFRKIYINSDELYVNLSNLSTLAAELCIPFEIAMQYHYIGKHGC